MPAPSGCDEPEPEPAVIAKVMRGRKVGGLLRYLYGPGKANEHVDPHLVASWDDAPASLEPAWLAGRHDLRHLAGLLEQPLAATVRTPERPVWHCAVRTAPTDRRLTDAQLRDTVREVVARTGLAPAGDDGLLAAAMDDGLPAQRLTHPWHLHRLGALTVRLHQHAARWSPPPGFVRIRWDHRIFFGDTMVYGGIPALQVWNLLPTRLHRQFDRVAERTGTLMAVLGDGPDQFTLIHADLHLDNALFQHGEVRVIDFDHCGPG